VFLTGIGVFVTGFSSILTGLNFMVTIHRMRAPGLTWFRLPLFVWAVYATSLVQILGTPVIAITVLMLALERVAGLGIFNPALGGDPVLFQHLFWFYSHPAVYIMILPPMGAISEVIACFSRKQVFGYSFVAFSSLAIAVFGFLVWAHHLFVAGISPYSALVFSILTYAVAVPSAVKTFNWTATIVQGRHLVEGADDLGVRFPGPLPRSAVSPASSPRRSVSTSTSTTPTSWSPTSTTSWLAAPSWATSPVSTSGGRR
jgi:cytochrome c oxidase subunit 1